MESTSTTSFLNAALANERPIFGRRQVQHVPPHPVIHLVAASGKIVMVLANKSIQRVDQTAADASVETIDLAKTIGLKCKPYAAFLDPTGTHLVISLKPTSEDMMPDLVYLSRKSTKPKMSTKIRGHLVTAIGWNPLNKSESSSNSVLIGTTMGLVFEAEFDGEDRMFASGLEKQWKQVLDIGKGRHCPITGLQFHCKGRRCFVMVTTVNQLFQYSGVFDDEKSLFANVFRDDMLPSNEVSSVLKYSLLSCSYRIKSLGKSATIWPLEPTKYAWLTEQGILSGTLNYDAKNPIEGGDVVALPRMNQNSENLGEKFPNSIILTEFHCLLAYTNRILGISMLNHAIMFDDELDLQYGQIKGISRDVTSGVIYAFSDYAIYQYCVEREERNVWKDYLEKGDYASAIRFCLGDEKKMDVVLSAQAEELFENGKYVESAKYFGKTKRKFEQIALKFMPLEEKTALLSFLYHRLDVVKPSETTQLTMLVVWLFEIYLNMMGSKASIKVPTKFDHDVEVVDDALTDQTSSKMFDLLKITKVRECVVNNKMTFYELLASHGDKKNMIKFGHLLQDYDRIIRLHLQDNEYVPALKILETQRRPEMFYHYGPLLMPQIPTRFVSSIIQQGKRLNPSRMIPSLVVSNRETQELESIRYLEFCIQSLGSKAMSIHNFLLSLYVKHQREKVLKYLDSHCKDPDSIYFDVNYVLRLCTEQGSQLRRACVLLHCMLGQLDQAVELALEDGDMKQAKFCLQFAKEEDKAKRIWLRIAKYVVQDKNDIKQAMDFMRECDGLVKIEDVLPFFPDFVTIDDFKDAICESLQEYSKHIQELKDEMEEAYDAAKNIREDIQKFKKRHIFVKSSDVCSICNDYLLAKPFHLFYLFAQIPHRLFDQECDTSPVVAEEKEGERAASYHVRPRVTIEKRRYCFCQQSAQRWKVVEKGTSENRTRRFGGK